MPLYRCASGLYILQALDLNIPFVSLWPAPGVHKTSVLGTPLK
jgi:hypothetical protein